MASLLPFQSLRNAFLIHIIAVVIFAQITSQSSAFKPSTIIIEQYRPPVGSIVVEFPAGLVDAEEDAAQAAVRELKEETGFDATLGDVVHVGPMTGADPGIFLTIPSYSYFVVNG